MSAGARGKKRDRKESSKDDNVCNIDKILDVRMAKGKAEYLVQWDGFEDSNNTWEPRENFRGFEKCIEKFGERVQGQ